MSGSDERLDELVRAVSKSSKYRHVCQDLIRHIGERELTIRRNVREAIKATKSKLHQVGGAYWAGDLNYAQALDKLRRAAALRDSDELRQVCAELMSQHVSTRERVTILDQFYAATLAGIGPVRVVLDLACGLNPLAISWMSLDERAEYYACDVYVDMIEFIRESLALLGVQGRAEARDVTRSIPTQRADLALILKTIPCLEQIEKDAGRRLLETVNADHVLVSFPVHSLGGRSKGMLENYEARFRELVRDKAWPVQRFEFSTELAFLVTKIG